MSSDLARVAVIAGGLSNEREVSWRSGRRAQYALGQAGVDATLYDADEALLDRLKADRVEAAYVAVHGASGEDGSLQTALDLIGIPYVGSPPASCHLAWDKVVAKVLVARAGLPTPAWAAISARSFRELSPTQIIRSVTRRARATRRRQARDQRFDARHEPGLGRGGPAGRAGALLHVR